MARDAIVQAVQVLNSLVTLKLKVQELRAEALKVRAQVDILFTDEPISEERSKKASRFLKPLANLRYQEAKSQARAVLDQS